MEEAEVTAAAAPARWLLRTILVAIASSWLVACGSTPSPAATPSTVTGAARWCGLRKGRPAVDKVMVVWEENHDYGSIIGSRQAPLFNRIAARCGLATDYRAVTHPSLPNYLTSTSGRSYARAPFSGDCSPGGRCGSTGASIFGQEVGAGRQWRSYEDAMPSPCARRDAGSYAVRHNPAVYYSQLAAQCPQWDLPLGTVHSGALATAVRTAALPAFAVVTPDVEHDMHDGSVRQAEAWLSPWLEAITSGPDYRQGRLAVIVVWDEGSGSGNAPSHAPLLVLSASTPAGARDTASLNDLSLLRTCEDLTTTGPPLGGAATATSFAAAFHLSSP